MGTHRRIDRWLPAAIEELAAAATAAAQHDAGDAPTTGSDDDTGPSNTEVVRFLCQPAPWPLAAILNDLCQRCEVEPPSCISEAMEACQPLQWDTIS